MFGRLWRGSGQDAARSVSMKLQSKQKYVVGWLTVKDAIGDSPCPCRAIAEVVLNKPLNNEESKYPRIACIFIQVMECGKSMKTIYSCADKCRLSVLSPHCPCYPKERSLIPALFSLDPCAPNCGMTRTRRIPRIEKYAGRDHLHSAYASDHHSTDQFVRIPQKYTIEMRLSGLQRDVLALYRQCLRESRKKPKVRGPWSSHELLMSNERIGV